MKMITISEEEYLVLKCKHAPAAQGSDDTKRMDWLERNLRNLYVQGPYMDGCNIGGSLYNEARGSAAGPSYIKVHAPSIRKALDEAMKFGKPPAPQGERQG